MNDPNVFEITTTEHHHWPTCPCGRCEAKRERRGRNTIPPRTPLMTMSVEAALLFGYLACRNPHGSLARELSARER